MIFWNQAGFGDAGGVVFGVLDRALQLPIRHPPLGRFGVGGFGALAGPEELTQKALAHVHLNVRLTGWGAREAAQVVVAACCIAMSLSSQAAARSPGATATA